MPAGRLHRMIGRDLGCSASCLVMVLGAGALASAAWAQPPAPAANEPVAPADPGAMPVAVPLKEYRAIELAGFRVLVEPAEFDAGSMRWRRTRAAMLSDLERIAQVLPADALRVVRTVPIVVTSETPDRPDWSAAAAVYHASAGWLTTHGFDAAREGVVEICWMDKYLLWRAEQPSMLLHELAHAYHAILGFEREDIKRAYQAAVASEMYEQVGHVLHPGEPRRAYALSNEREYFAELTEAYFGRNDFFPFTREDLRGFDPEGFALVRRLWGDAERPAAVIIDSP